jgi:hypothetical protein
MEYLARLQKMQRCIRMFRLVVKQETDCFTNLARDLGGDDVSDNLKMKVVKQVAFDLVLEEQINGLRFTFPGDLVNRFDNVKSYFDMLHLIDELSDLVEKDLGILSDRQKKAVESIVENSNCKATSEMMCEAFCHFFRSTGEPVDVDFFYRCVGVKQ